MKQVYFLLLATLIRTAAFTQDKKDSTSNGDAIAQQMFDYSRPGKYHQVLADLIGTWTFKGRRFPLKPDSSKAKFDFFGTHIRKPFADGRYFIVDMTMGDSLHKQLIPVQDGKMKEVIGKGIAIEGYNNVKRNLNRLILPITLEVT